MTPAAAGLLPSGRTLQREVMVQCWEVCRGWGQASLAARECPMDGAHLAALMAAAMESLQAEGIVGQVPEGGRRDQHAAS